MPSGWTRKRGSTWTWYIEDVPDPSTGRPRQVSKGGFRTRKEARDALLQAQAALRSGTFVEPSKRTVRVRARASRAVTTPRLPLAMPSCRIALWPQTTRSPTATSRSSTRSRSGPRRPWRASTCWQ